MKVLSHRGYWKTPVEKNSMEAFAHSFKLGLGTETDFRDLDGQLVVSHDPPRSGATLATAFFALLSSYDPSLPLAINVKSDGLQLWIKQAIEDYQLKNAFVFDMSIPDARGYLRAGVPTFTRQSELEPDPAFYDQAAGVWVDCFESEWMDESSIERHLKAGKQVCLVSPELHGRSPLPFWERLSRWSCRTDPQVMICTDLPEDVSRILAV